MVSRWAEIVGERYAKVSTPESIRFPAGKKFGGTLTLSVEGAHAPLMQHLGPLIIERVNRFFGYEAINKLAFRQGRIAETDIERCSAQPPRRCPRNWARAFARLPILSFAPALNCWLASLPGRAARPTSTFFQPLAIPIIRSK